MVDHAQIWQGIDRLAESHGLSPAALARRAGLDPSTFNRSKRRNRDGKPRWPSTESLIKALDAVGASPETFWRLAAGGAPPPGVALPLVPAWRSEADEAHAPGLDEAGRPVGQARETLFPAPDDPYAFVLELDGTAPPPYRPGDLLVVSPAAALRPGDAVALRTLAGMLHLGRLRRQDGARVVLTRHGQTDLSVAAGAVAWISRVLWASQ